MVYTNVNASLSNIDSPINHPGCEGGDSNANEAKICNSEVSVTFQAATIMHRETSKENQRDTIY